MRDATPRTSDRERRNWARRFDWLELRCQDRVRVRRTASELESSPIVIESQLSSSRSKSPELTRRRRLWLSESDIALGLFLESRWRGRQRRRARDSGGAPEKTRPVQRLPKDFLFRQVHWRDETRFGIFSVAIMILGVSALSCSTHEQKREAEKVELPRARTCLARVMHKPQSATFPAWNPIWSVRDLIRDLTTHPLTLAVLRAARTLFVLRSALL